MIKINIICIGKIKEKYFTDAIAEYAKRLTAFCKFNIIELSEERIKSNIPNRSQIDEVIFSEGKRIMQKISPSDYVVAMCIEGKSMSSEELSKLIDNASVSGKSTVDFIIGGSYQGIPQNDVGIRTDVLDCCSKAEGMVMLLRSMAPQVIAVDEIGNYEDIRAIEMTLNSGCKLLATVHGSSIDEIRKKPLLERLMKEHVFERYIILQKETAGQIGKVQEIYDERGTCLYQRQRSVC